MAAEAMPALLLLVLASSLAGPGAVGKLLRQQGQGGGSSIQPESTVVPYRQRLENFMNMQYHGKISIGGQLVPAIFDTGSFEIVVTSTRCKQCKDPMYNPANSKTFRPSKPLKTVTHEYGSGPASSELGYEDVKVGTLTSANQAFYQIVKHDIEVLDSASFDAIVGIAPEGHNLTEKTLLDKLHVWDYSLCLEPADGAPGWLTWGGDLTREQKASAAVLPVVGRHHWAVSMQNLMPAMPLSKAQIEHAQTLLCGRGCAAILDSGTSLIAAPSYALRGLEILLPKLHADCSNFADLPHLEVTLGGHKVSLPPETYVVRLRGSATDMENAANLLHFKGERASAGRSAAAVGDECMYGFMEVNLHSDFGPIWIFGMPFFRLFHTTFSNAPRPEDRKILLMGASDDCTPQPPEVEKVAGVTEAPEYKGAMGVFPKMTVFNAVGPEQRRERTRRGPVTLEARDLRPPSLPSFESL